MNASLLRARTASVERRIRAARAGRAAVATLAPGLAGVAIAVASSRLGWLAPANLRVALALGLGVPTLVALASALRRLPTLLAAELLDRAHDLHGRITSGLELTSAAPGSLAALALEDAVTHAQGSSPARAFPWRWPAQTRSLVLAALTVAIATTLRPPPPPAVLAAPPPTLRPLLVHRDDLALERDALAELTARSEPTPELHRAIDDTNALLEALEDRALTRTDALRALAELAERLDRPRPTSLVAREEILEAIGDRLGRGETTADLSSALREADAARAAAALGALADRLRAHGMSAQERRRLQEALAEARAAEGDDAGDRELEDAERALEEQRAAPPGEEEERLLHQREEEVQRLREQHERRMEAERELERLERELGEAADRMTGPEQDPDAADALDEAAEDLNRTARDQASEEQMQQLAEQLRQLREMIRRQREQAGGGGEDGEGGEGSGRGSESGEPGRMDRFVLRAGGGSEGGGQGVRLGTRSGSGSGEDGQTRGSEGTGEEEGEGTPGGTSGSAAGEDGEGGDQPGGEEGQEQQVLVLGGEGGDAILELPGFGRSGAGRAQGGGDGDGDGRDGAGTGHDGTSLADPTARAGDHQTVAVHGEDRGQGASRSEVIRGGAARGFASRDYERVYAEYEAHAERAIERDEVPPGYRFYVRRYFDLIRPRD